MRSVLVAAVLAVVSVAPVEAQRSRLQAAPGSGCGTLSASYVVVLDGAGSGAVLSSASFPGANRVTVARAQISGGPPALYPDLEIHHEAGTTGSGELFLLRGRVPTKVRGCIGFDKDLFTWSSDVLSYVNYLAQLLEQAQRLDPSQTTLVASDRTVELEVTRPGRDRALLRGKEGAMLGYGRKEDEVRYLFVPTLLGSSGDTMMVQVLRNRGSAYGEKATEPLLSVLVDGREQVVTQTDPAFEIRRVQ